jgi:hypothetical protein
VWKDVTSFWYAPLDWVNFTDQELFTAEMSLVKRFLLNLYYGILILGCNEIGPTSELEMLGCGFFLIISSFMNAVVFGDIASQVSNLLNKD